MKVPEIEIVSWGDSFATGIRLVDEQHKELIKLTNELYRACLIGVEETGPVFKEALSCTVEYVRFHFAAELEILEKVNYPDYNEHKKQHEFLIKHILAASKEFGSGKKFIPNQFVRTLKDWVFGHIAFYDKQFAAYIADQKSKGLLDDL